MTIKAFNSNLAKLGSFIRRKQIFGFLGIICIGILLVLALLFRFDKGPGGWAWGYGLQYVILGFFIALIGIAAFIIQIVIGKHKSLSSIGLILTSISFIFLIPFAPLAIKSFTLLFWNGKPTQTDRAWYLLDSNRESIVNSLPNGDHSVEMTTICFLEAVSPRLTKADAKNIEIIINNFNRASQFPSSVRAQEAMASLNVIAQNYNNERPWYDKQFGNHSVKDPQRPNP